jgi:integrase
MAESVNLTPERIRKLTCGNGKSQEFLRDKSTPLAVRVTPAGAKSFIFEAKLNRQTIRRTIGGVDTWLLDNARIEARRLKVMIDRGQDPRELEREEAATKSAKQREAEIATKNAESAKQYTLRALLDAYTKMLTAKDKKKSAKAAESAFKCWIPDEIASKQANIITTEEIAKLLRAPRDKGKERTAGVLRSYLMAAYGAAQRAPYDSALPADLIGFTVTSNPASRIPAIAVRAGNRVLSATELKMYMAGLGDDLQGKALRLALYAGGQRMSQLLRATAGDYDATTQTLRLFDGKGRRRSVREHLLPLAPKAATIVAELLKRATEKETAFLFSSDGRRQMVVTTPGARVAEVCATMKGIPFDLRDIRRTCETMLAGMGISRDVRAQLLSHGISGVQAAHYDRHAYMDEKRAALVAWEARLDEIATGKQNAGNVRKLRKTAA